MARPDRLDLEQFLSDVEHLIEAIIHAPADSDDVARLSRTHWKRLSHLSAISASMRVPARSYCIRG